MTEPVYLDDRDFVDLVTRMRPITNAFEHLKKAGAEITGGKDVILKDLDKGSLQRDMRHVLDKINEASMYLSILQSDIMQELV